MLNMVLYFGSIVAAFGIILLLVASIIPKLCHPVSLTQGTRKLLDDEQAEAVRNLLSIGSRLPLRDLVSIYWNSRILLQVAHTESLRHPDDLVLDKLREIEEEAHARTCRNIRLHIHERIGCGHLDAATQIYSALLLDSYCEELTVLDLIAERNLEMGRPAVKGWD